MTLGLRFRSDISSDIRVICVAELGCWIKLYPDLFLDNNYLKYIGWMLYDKVPRAAGLPPPPRRPPGPRSCPAVPGASTRVLHGVS